MTWAEYQKNRTKNSDMSSVFNNLKRDIENQLKTGPTKTECETLSNYLTEVLYDKGKSPQGNSKINKIVEQAYEYHTKKALDNFQLGAKHHYTPEQVGKIARERHESTKHKNYIKQQTIESRIKKVEKLLEQIKTNKVKKSVQQLEQAKKGLIDLKKEMEFFLSRYGKEGNEKVKIELDGNYVFSFLKDIDQKYEQFLTTSVADLTPKDYGDVLEYALNTLNYDIEQVKEESISDIIAQIAKTEGSATTGGKDAIVLDTSISALNPNNSNKKSKKNETFELNLGGVKINYSQTLNADSSRQGKMDVHLKSANNKRLKRDFRISAKNWTQLNDRDFGSTSMAYALLRSLEKYNTQHFICVMADEEVEENKLSQAHALAKLAIVADILMGYSQKENYADTLVINVRGAQPQVIVKSLKDIFNQLSSNIEALKGLPVKGYESKNLAENIQTIRRESVNRFGNIAFTDLAMSYLNDIRVSVVYSDLMKQIAD